MANKKINELVTRTPSLSDLMLVGDPSSGYSYKCTITSLATIIETDISDGYVTLTTAQTISGAKTFSNILTLTSVANATTDPDKFLVLNASNVVNYRTGSEVLSDIGGQGALTLTTTGSSGAATLVGNTLNIPQYTDQYVGTVTSVAMSVPTGLSVSGSPITTSGTLAVTLQSGYSIPTTASQSNWDSAYNNMIVSAAVTGTTTKTLTLTQQDAGTITASWTDDNTDAVTSVFGRTGAVVATEGDYSLTQLSDVTITTPTNGQVLKYNGTTWVNDTDANTGTVTSVAMSVPTGLSVSGSPITSSGTLAVTFSSGYSIPTTASQTNWDTAYTNRITSLTTTGSSGAATLISNTLNIPNYTLAGLGGISLTSLSALAPLSYSNTTGVFSISKATASVDGYLSYTDWNFFADKIGGSGTTNYIPKFTSSSAIGNSIVQETASGINVAFSNSGASNVFEFQNTSNTASSNSRLKIATGGTSGGNAILQFTDNNSNWYINPDGAASYALKIGTSISDNKLVLTTSGNLGLGVTPSAWGSGQIAFEFGARGGLSADGSGTYVDNNRYYNGTNSIYKQTGGASLYGQFSGTHQWYIAPSGTAGNAITFTQAMTLDASGNLGIGTTNPSYLLDITALGYGIQHYGNSTNSLRTYAGSGYQVIEATTSTGVSQFGYVSSNFFVEAGGSERMRITSGGNVGINTQTPATFLHVLGSNTTDRGQLSIQSNNASNAAKATWYYNTTNQGEIGTTGSDFYALAVNNFAFYAGGSERMRITSGGNVGIGTTSPSQLLHLKTELGTSSGVGTAIQIESGGAGGDQAWIGVNKGSGNGLELSVENRDIIFNTGATTPFGGSERMRITSGGDVGIGTTSPQSQLHIYNNSAGATFRLQGTRTADGEVGVINFSNITDITGGYIIGSIAVNRSGFDNGGAMIFSTATAASTPTERMRITSGGEVQLKPAANTAALSTSGSYSLTGSNAQSLLDLAGTWNTTGNPTAIKLNITNTASGATSNLMDLQVGGTSQFLVDKSGNTVITGSIKTGDPTGGTKKPWKFGTAVVTSVSHYGYAQVEIDGVAYYVGLVTAN